MTEQHTIHLPVIRYRDKAGNPTCAADSGSKYADNMMRRDGAQGPGMGTLIPGDWCPVWEPTKAKRPA